MRQANYDNLKKDLCPYCKKELEISSECGRRKCKTKGCFFTMSRETISKMFNLPEEVCRYSLKKSTLSS